MRPINLVPAIAAELVRGAEDVLRQAAAIATGNQGEYIAFGTPESIHGRIQQGIARQACRRYADNPGAFSGAAAVLVEKSCRPYLDSIGYGGGPSLELPFRGGQCVGVAYQVNWTRDTPGVGPVPQSIVRQGPLGFNRDLQEGELGVDCGVPGRTFNRYTLTSPQGDVNLGSGCGVVVSGISVARVDGLPDECGSPPPILEDPEPPPVPGPDREPFTIAPDIDIDIEVQIGPENVINVDIGAGPISIDPFGGQDGDGGGDDGSPGAPELGPVTPGGNGGFGGDDELGEPPAGKRWVGVAMSISERPEGFGVITSVTPDKVYPEVVGNARLIYNAFGFEVVGTPVQIRSDRVTLWEEVRGANPVALRVNLKAGFGYQFAGIAQPEDN